MNSLKKFRNPLLVIALLTLILSSCCMGMPMMQRPYYNYRPIHPGRMMYMPRPNYGHMGGHPHYGNHGMGGHYGGGRPR